MATPEMPSSRAREEVPAMAEASTAERIKEIICEQLGVSNDEVNLDSSFIEDLGADSLDIVELVMALEEEFSKNTVKSLSKNTLGRKQEHFWPTQNTLANDVANHIENPKHFPYRMLQTRSEPKTLLKTPLIISGMIRGVTFVQKHE